MKTPNTPESRKGHNVHDFLQHAENQCRTYYISAGIVLMYNPDTKQFLSYMVGDMKDIVVGLGNTMVSNKGLNSVITNTYELYLEKTKGKSKTGIWSRAKKYFSKYFLGK